VLQGDRDWVELVKAIVADDRVAALSHNARAPSDTRLRLPFGPVPFVGAIMTAPVVLLLTHPPSQDAPGAEGYAFRRSGWPLSLLHPHACATSAEWWRDRLAALIHRFGAEHVAHSVAALFLTPWHAQRFDERLRLPSRARMLALAASAARRDAVLVVPDMGDLWTEHPEIASLPLTRRVHARSHRRCHLTPDNLGDAWQAMCARIAVHAWL
jgi:hypothetical protein